MRRMVERAAFLVRRDHTLGNIMERLASVHGERHLVTEAHGGLDLSYMQAAKRVARWAGGIAVPGRARRRRRRSPPANGYQQLLLCLAVARAGCHPRPGERRHAPRRDRATSSTTPAPRFVLRSAHEVDGHEPLAQGGRRRRPATWPRSSTPRAPPASPRVRPSPTTPCSARSGRGALLPSQPAPRRGRRQPAGRPHHGVRHPARPGRRRRSPPGSPPASGRARSSTPSRSGGPSVFIGVPAMYRLMLEAGAADRDLGSIRVWGSGADVMPAELARQFKRMGATRAPARASATSARRRSPRATAWSRPAAGSPPRSARRSCRSALGDAMGFPIPGYRLRVVDDEGNDVGLGETGELLVKGPGVLRGYWHDEEATAAVLDADGLAAHRRPGPAGAARTIVLRRPQEGRRSCGAASRSTPSRSKPCSRTHPDVLEAAVVPPARRTAGRGARRRRSAWPTASASTTRARRPRPRAPGPLQGAGALHGGRRPCPAPGPTRSSGASSLSYFDETPPPEARPSPAARLQVDVQVPVDDLGGNRRRPAPDREKVADRPEPAGCWSVITKASASGSNVSGTRAAQG